MRTRKTGQIVSVSAAALLAWQSPASAGKVGHFKLPEFHVPEIHAPDLHVPDIHVPGHLDLPNVHVPEVHAPDVHVDVPNVHLPEHLDLGNIHLPEAHIDAPHLNAGNVDAPHINYDVLPPDPHNLNYGNLPPEGPNNIMGQLPPAYDRVPELPRALPDTPVVDRPLPPTPGNNPVGKLPSANYGALPSDPPITAAKPFKPADALGDLVGLPADHPGRVQANVVTKNVGVPTPIARTPTPRLPAPQILAQVAEAAPLRAPTAIKQGMKLSTKIVIGATVTTVGLVAVGVSMPAIVKKITGDDLPDTGNAEVDSAINGLTPP